jgi:hypothetical protein
MFKKINNTYINISHIKKIEDMGTDEKDGKNYCCVYTTFADETPIIVEGTLEDIISYLNK